MGIFPKDFLWGAATASFQVEGYPLADGAGPSNWHVFSHLPGRVANDHNGDISAAQYLKYKEDVRLMKWMGLGAYRFSISWSRVFPEGEGRINPKGLDYYDRLIDELLANGIQPWATMFHWDLPQALEDKYGGWRSKDTAKAFGDYVAYVGSRIGDRVKNYFTVNEIFCFTRLGYENGVFAPGLKLDRKTVAQTVHNGCLAHGYGVKALRENVENANIGLAENMSPTVPVYPDAEHIAAARTAFRHHSADKLTVMMEGAYPDFWLESMGSDAPEFNDEELSLIGQKLDFVGINIYAPAFVRADPGSKHGFADVEFPESYPRMNMPWLRICPDITYWTPRFLKELWNVDAVYVTENGCAAMDKYSPDGEIYDTDRVMYLQNHFRCAARAVEEGWPLKGYFVWSLLDNFEWACGYEKRFGLVYVNYQTLERTPKLSAKYYREVIRGGTL